MFRCRLTVVTAGLVCLIAGSAFAAGGDRRPGAPTVTAPPPPRTRTKQNAAQSYAKFEAYMNWVRQVERDRAALRAAAIKAATPAQAMDLVSAFLRDGLRQRTVDYSFPTSTIHTANRGYYEAVRREAEYARDMLRFYAANKPGSAAARAEGWVKLIDKDLQFMNQALAEAYAKRGLSGAPVIAPCRTGSYFGYLATRAGK